LHPVWKDDYSRYQPDEEINVIVIGLQEFVDDSYFD
jgi:hypothetical protein